MTLDLTKLKKKDNNDIIIDITEQYNAECPENYISLKKIALEIEDKEFEGIIYDKGLDFILDKLGYKLNFLDIEQAGLISLVNTESNKATIGHCCHIVKGMKFMTIIDFTQFDMKKANSTPLV